MGHRRLLPGEKGWTLVELMIAVAILAIITPSVTYLFMKLSQGMAADEMHVQLQSLNEQTLLRIHERVISGRHFFQADSSGTSFLGPVTLGMTATTKSLYPILSGSNLALSQPSTGTGTFSPSSSVAANFGNSILFGAYDTPQTLKGVSYIAPVTINGVKNDNGNATTLIIDLYRIYYYYLTTDNPKALDNVASYRLMEWQSIQLVDMSEITGIVDNNNTLNNNAVSWLVKSGDVSSGPLTLGWDPTQSSPVSAFYSLNSNGTYTLLSMPVTVPEGVAQIMTHVSSGILSTGFRYGICGNTAGWKDKPPGHDVPQFATATGAFPGGFEVGVSGTAAGRQILTRCLLVAQGATPKVEFNDVTMVHNMRDVW